MQTEEQSKDKATISLNDLLRDKLNKKREGRRVSRKGKSGQAQYGMQNPGNSGYLHDHQGRFNKYVVE